MKRNTICFSVAASTLLAFACGGEPGLSSQGEYDEKTPDSEFDVNSKEAEPTSAAESVVSGVADEGGEPTSNPEFVQPVGDEPGEATDDDSTDNVIQRVDVGDGNVTFLDEGEGGVAVLAAGASVELVQHLLQQRTASPQEVFQYLAPNAEVPKLLLENHRALAEAGRVPDVARAPSELGIPEPSSTLLAWDVVPFKNGSQCPRNFSYSFWRIGWATFASDYGDNLQYGIIHEDSTLLTADTFSHALGACYHDRGSGHIITAKVQIKKSGVWTTLDKQKVSFEGENGGAALYYWRDWHITRQSRMILTGVSGDDIYVGANWGATAGFSL